MRDKPTESDNRLGRRVKWLREEAGMSRRTLAERSRMSYAFVQQLETGVRSDPGARKLAQIAAALGVTVDTLLVDEEKGAPESSGGRSTLVDPARRELDEILDTLDVDDLVRVCELIKLWVGSTTAPTPDTARG